jgi:hypothetical protein
MFEYLKYWIYTNIIHINHSMEFIWFLYKPMKIDAHNLYEPMKLDKFVMIGYQKT